MPNKKHILIITAHPSPHGFTHRIAASYKKGHEDLGNTVEILDLYKTELQQPYLKFDNPKELKDPDPIRDIIHKKISESNQLVFIHPLWWVGAPAIMKNFIDVNLSSGFAFRYEKGVPVGLLTEKTSRVFITCDGAPWVYWVIAMPFWTIWNFGVLRFCGTTVQGIHVINKKFKFTPEDEEKYLKKVYKLTHRDRPNLLEWLINKILPCLNSIRMK